MDDGTLAVTERTRHRRLAEKASVSRGDLEAILAAGFVCHLACMLEGAPIALPTVYGFDAQRNLMFLHGSVASRSLVEAPGQTVCVSVTHVDGLVLARSVFEHSVNYRSAMVFGVLRVVTGTEERLHGLRVLSEQAAPGQWGYARAPSRKELAATCLLALEVEEASVKINEGFPDDGEGPDAALPVWAGKLPLLHTWGAARSDPLLDETVPVPGHVAARVGLPADRSADPTLGPAHQDMLPGTPLNGPTTAEVIQPP